MDDGNGKLYSKLPRAVAGKAFNTLPSNPDASFDMFLKTSLSEKALFESENELKRSILLKKHKKKIQGKTRQRKTYLSRKERKELGLNKLDYKNLKFRDFHSLHQLWKKYMRNYLNLDNLKNLRQRRRQAEEQRAAAPGQGGVRGGVREGEALQVLQPHRQEGHHPVRHPQHLHRHRPEERSQKNPKRIMHIFCVIG
ncbi:uncharacterized protein LOC134533803 isoform X2 [Bacillus rossius redtenbacheri]|uniref:uncharacterized protein LOC134533803 isoform X2 n=1 Tax=Bacillus rossius redtenbacheri TaxID=93214 RepID=UPI002FDD6101